MGVWNLAYKGKLDRINDSPITHRIMKRLSDLGFDAWFQEKLRACDHSDQDVARVTAVNKDGCLIRNGEAEIPAGLAGKLTFSAESKADLPTVGDWVLITPISSGSHATINHVLPRRSLLKRKVAGKKVDFQLIAANIDTAFIMQSLDSNFNLRRLERYLVMTNESNIRPVILLSKSDLLSEEALAVTTASLRASFDEYRSIAFSAVSKDGLDLVQNEIVPGKTYCLLGSSGVGKTTLLNRLIGFDQFSTNSVREKDSRGRHTTSIRKLTVLEQGAMVIDTPGMRELGNFGVGDSIEDTFDDIRQYAGQCRFNDCRHVSETGCAVLEAVNNKLIDAGRYQNYLKLQKESAYYEMSHTEKRRRERKFGKLTKSVLKQRKRKKFY